MPMRGIGPLPECVIQVVKGASAVFGPRKTMVKVQIGRHLIVRLAQLVVCFSVVNFQLAPVFCF